MNVDSPSGQTPVSVECFFPFRVPLCLFLSTSRRKPERFYTLERDGKLKSLCTRLLSGTNKIGQSQSPKQRSEFSWNWLRPFNRTDDILTIEWFINITPWQDLLSNRTKDRIFLYKRCCVLRTESLKTLVEKRVKHGEKGPMLLSTVTFLSCTSKVSDINVHLKEDKLWETLMVYGTCTKH